MKTKPREAHQACLDAAFRHLRYRPRSESEVRSHLEKKGFDARTVQAVVLDLERRGLLDDMAFARFWKENRESFSPRSRAMVRWELRCKGVPADVAAQVIEDIDDEESASRAAAKMAARLSGTDYETFRRRLGAFLKRRGFRHEAAQHAIDNLWQGRNENA